MSLVIIFPIFIINILSFLLLLVNGTTTTTTTADGVNYGDKDILRPLNNLHSSSTTSTNSLSQKSRTQNGATILEIQHTNSFSKPIHDRNQRLQNRLIYDDIRVRSFQSRNRNMAPGQTQAQIPITSGVKLQTLNYVVTVELGGRNMTMIVDTGSDLTWVQCQPCKSCYNQREPLLIQS